MRMSAYSGVTANFPTVFSVAAPERGPKHLRAQPFHLGKGATTELEADIGLTKMVSTTSVLQRM